MSREPEDTTVRRAAPSPAARGPFGHRLLEASPAFALVALLAAFLGPWWHAPEDFSRRPRMTGTGAGAPPRPPLAPPVLAPRVAPAASSSPAPAEAVPDPARPTPGPAPVAKPTTTARREAARVRPAAPAPEPAVPSPAPPPPPAAEPVEVAFTSRPLGEPVSVDGAPRGSTPLRLTLTPGRHTLSFGSGEQAATAEIEVVAGGRALWTYFTSEGAIR